MGKKAIKWRVSSTLAEKLQIFARAAAARMGPSAYVVHCCLRDDIPAPTRMALPPKADERLFLELLLYAVMETLKLLRQIARRDAGALRDIASGAHLRGTSASSGSSLQEDAERILQLQRSTMERLGNLIEEILGRL